MCSHQTCFLGSKYEPQPQMELWCIWSPGNVSGGFKAVLLKTEASVEADVVICVYYYSCLLNSM